MALVAGTTFGAFRVVGPLGQGGMATVYRAYEAALDREIALKVLPAELLQEPTFAERFRREAKVVARLEHPNIIPIYAFGIEGAVPWMSMRLIRGGSLSGLLKEGLRLPLGDALAVLRGIATALDHAHQNGIVHRDIKPQNILLDEGRNTYLTDFGIARMVEGSPGLTRTGVITGTPQYMAPEQATGKPVDHRADIYALGIVAYELLTGRVPFRADTPVAVLMKHISDPIPLPPVTQVPEGVTRALLKALAKDPTARWPTAGGFADALHGAYGVEATASLLGAAGADGDSGADRTTRAVAPRSTGARARVPPVRQRVSRRVAVILGALSVGVLALAAAGVWLVLEQRGPSPSPSRGPAITAPSLDLPDTASRPKESADASPLETPESKPMGTPGEPLESDPATSPARSVARPAATGLVKATPRPAPAPVGAAEDRLFEPDERVGDDLSATSAVSEAPAGPVDVSASAEPVATPVAPTVAPTAAAEPPPMRSNPSDRTVLFGQKIDLGGEGIGPITLRTVQFRTRKQELQAEVEVDCAEGKDQRLSLSLVLLDASGASLGELTGNWEVDEGDDSRFKMKKRFAPEIIQAMARFRLSGESRDD